MIRAVRFVLLATAALALTPPALAWQAPAANSPAAWGQQATDVVPDPAIRYGRLANGMRYAIRKNATPKGTAAVRLNIGFGSLGESDAERGLAHFIEHLAFNGTTNVPEGDMIKLLERQGLAFGPDTNAQTGFDATTYMLDIPQADAARMDTALFLMREIASEVTFDPAAVNRERGVIEGERRARDSYQIRYLLGLLDFQAPGTPYAKRIPIGTTDVITKVDAARIADLYRRYYRPENATLVVVGDIDPDVVEAKIRAKFGDWRGKGPAGAPLPRGTVDLKRPAAFGTFVDPATPTSVTLSVLRPWDDPADTIAERRRKLIRNVAVGMFNKRLARIANAPNSPLLGGSMDVDSQFRDQALQSSVSLYAKDGEWKSALTTIEQEVRRAREFGFTQAELKRQMADLTTRAETEAAQADTRTSQALAGQIVSNIIERQVITAPAWRLAQFKATAPTITLAEVNAEFNRLWTGSAPVTYISDKAPIGTPQQLAAAYATSRAVKVAAPADNGALAFAYDSFGAPGKVVADKVDAASGVRQIRFANNVRLNLKKTDFEKGRVRYSVRMAGGQLALPRSLPGLDMTMSATSDIGATRKQSLEDLKEVMAGKLISYGVQVEDDAFVSNGITTPADLAAQMKVSAAFMTDPGYRPEAASQFANLLPVIDRQIRAQPAAVAQAILPAILANDDWRFGVPPAAELAKRDLKQLAAAYAPVAANAPIEIGVVGDLDEAQTIAAVAASFGALPARAAAEPAYAQARTARFRSSLAPITLTHTGGADQAMVVEAWPAFDDSDVQRVTTLALLTTVFQNMLVDEIREQLGASYGASVDASLSDTYKDFGTVTASAVVSPTKMDEVEKVIAAAAATLRDKPVDADVLARARNPLLQRADRSLRENGNWLTRVAVAQSDPFRLTRMLTTRQRLGAVTAADLQRMARQVFDPARQVKVRIVSDKLAKPAS
ncbi:insulinase family protein [Sphingomonas rhizophila]|uniref:Insulinase family protein n=1 Tax=Sphingomonas rhizophila TaxID=2071607 RepID=A0A7G9SCI5_9SPHN|nr:M16 family metallopeptidase [Sphingomonas rhizophila]QNN65560.1 insulinase family protein [Sphingomonas rhizophila]